MSGGEILFAVLRPSNAILFLVVCGALAMAVRPRLGAVVLSAGILLLAVAGLLPVGTALLRPLETATAIPDIGAAPDAIVVLGGFIAGDWDGPVPLDFDDSADRMTAAATLASRWPGVRIVITDGAERAGDTPGAVLAADWLMSTGVPRETIVVEPRAVSTWDNAVYAKGLVDPVPGGAYLLVTSASHMPRALAVFRAAGWPEPIPYPVDGAGRSPAPLGVNPSVAVGLSDLDEAAREWAAIGWYAVTGRLRDFRL